MNFNGNQNGALSAEYPSIPQWDSAPLAPLAAAAESPMLALPRDDYPLAVDDMELGDFLMEAMGDNSNGCHDALHCLDDVVAPQRLLLPPP